MNQLAIFILSVFVMINNVIAQPAVAWMRMYDNGRQEVFHDIYAVSDGGYIMCGGSGNDCYHRPPDGDEIWVVKTGRGGNLEWSETFHEGGLAQGYTIIETDEGDFMVAGRHNNNLFALRISDEGEEVWFNTYNNAIQCNAIIELKSGEFLLAGISQDRNGYLLCIDGEGNALWDEEYDARNRRDCFYSMRETQGGVVLTGDASCFERDLPMLVWIIKVNLEGEIIWSRNHNIFDRFVQSRSIVADVENGFLIGGYTNVDAGCDKNPFLLKINDEGMLEGVDYYDWDLDIEADNDRIKCIARLEDGGFIMVGYTYAPRGELAHRPIAIRVRRNRIERWRVGYEFANQDGYGDSWHEFNSVVQGQDGSIIAAGMLNFEDDASGLNGVLIKLEPEILEPSILHWEPQDTLLEVLQGDTIDFFVRVIDQQGDEMDYLWIMDEDTLSTDSTTTVIFDELGESVVQCQITDGEFTVGIAWHVRVLEWYIDIFQPDSIEITVRRRSSIDFTHHVRAIEDFEFEYGWEHFGRGGNFELDGRDSIRFNFDLPGEHLIRALVTRNDEIETVEWDVNARSIIWWWWPHEFELSAQQDTSIIFEVFPFNEESDSLVYSWFLNNEVLDCDSSSVELPFPEIGEYEITSYATEGIEADTIRWMVDVRERSFTTDDPDYENYPTSPVLFPASPNPINSSVRLSISLPVENHLSLSIFDINGRKAKQLIDNRTKAGYHTYLWNASDFPAGIYFVEMKVGSICKSMKVILVK